MNLIKRTLLIVLAAAAFAQPAYSMDVAIVARFIEFIRPHAAKVGWYGVNQVWYFVVGNGPVIAVSSYIAYLWVKKCLIDKLQRDLGVVKEDVKVIKKDTKEIKGTVGVIAEKQGEQGVVINEIKENVVIVDNKLSNMQNQLTGVEANVEQIKTDHTEALFSIIHEQQEQGGKIDIALKDISSNKEALKFINENIALIDTKANELVVLLKNKTIDKDELERQLAQLREDRGFLLKQIEELRSDNKAASESLEEEFGITKEKLSTLGSSLTNLTAHVNKFIMETSTKFQEVNGHLISIDENQVTMLKELKELKAQNERCEKAISELTKKLIIQEEKLEKQEVMLGKLLNFAEKNETNNEQLTKSVSNLEKIAVVALNNKTSDVKALPSTSDNPLNTGSRSGIWSAQNFGLKGISQSITLPIYPNQPLSPNYLSTNKK